MYLGRYVVVHGWHGYYQPGRYTIDTMSYCRRYRLDYLPMRYLSKYPGRYLGRYVGRYSAFIWRILGVKWLPRWSTSSSSVPASSVPASSKSIKLQPSLPSKAFPSFPSCGDSAHQLIVAVLITIVGSGRGCQESRRRSYRHQPEPHTARDRCKLPALNHPRMYVCLCCRLRAILLLQQWQPRNIVCPTPQPLSPTDGKLLLT